MKPIRTDNWSKGANNVASRDRLPENSVRAAINVDPLPGGRLALRAGFERAYSGAAVRAALALRNRLLIADGNQLIEHIPATGSTRALRTIAASGVMVGDVLNDRLYFCTADECLEYDGEVVRPWGVPDVVRQPAVSASAGGTLLEGHYQVAVTHTDQWGREGGTDRPAVIKVAAGSLLTIQVDSLPAGCTANLYVSPVNASTLYLQGTLTAPGSFAVGAVSDDRARCTTILLRAPRPGHIVRAHNGVLAVALERHVQITTPLRPHLESRTAGFVQYPVRVGAMLSANGMLFVSADKVYALSATETAEIQQRVVHEHPAIPGTELLMPDGRGAWMTRYGQVIAGGDGVALINRNNFAPVDARKGSAGLLEHNGNQLIVSALEGRTRPNPLASTDFFIGEVLTP